MYTMLVDDEQWIVRGLAGILRKRYPDMELALFTDPAEALAAVAERMPDLLVTDIRMPQMTGLELLEGVRALGLRFYAVLTGVDDVKTIQESMRLQATDYLIKPVNKAELYRLIDAVQARLAELSHRADAELTNLLRLCAMYGEPDARLAGLTTAYRSAAIARFDGDAPASAPDCPVAVELWRMDGCCWLYLSAQPVDVLRDSLAALRPKCFVAGDYRPETLHQQFVAALRDGAESPDSAVALFCSERDADAARLLAAQMARAAFPPDVLDDFCRAVGKALPYWSAVELAENTPSALCEVLRALPPLPDPRSADVRATLDWMRERYREHITLAEAASRVYLQANYFSTLFKRETGQSFIQCLNAVRVDEVCREIVRRPDASFEQIAQECGFASVRYFFATFKKHANLTPGDYRLLAQRLAR